MTNDDPVWVDLSPQEIEELRNKKHELTEYGKEQLRKLMNNQEPYPDEMFEEAAKREAANKMPREEVMKIAVGLIDKYDESFKILAAIERKELFEELETKKKENFQLVADACMEEYTKTYGEMPEDESWMFMEAQYYGTGEGQTTCLMMTQANPGQKEDFENSTNKYTACTTKEYRAVREFHKQFGTWHLYGLRFHTREAFFKNYANQLPATLVKLKDQQCFLEYHSELHYNFA